jgi:MFS family permease
MENSVKNPQPSNNPPAVSAWSPLRQAVFRSIWIATVVSNIGTWMQSVGVAWLMTSLTPSPLLVALMQTATSLPVFLLGLPAGTFADIFNRRKLLLATESWMLLVALTLGTLTLTGHISAWALLVLTFFMGMGSAFDGPAWQAIVPDLVERKELPSAVSLNAIGFNVARALGPALGGLVVAAAGPATVFLLNAISFVFVLVAVYRWRHAPVQNDLPPEEMLGATATGMRYVRHAPALQAVLMRIGVFTFGASALWALLPVVARHDLGVDATGYGIVLGSLGFGAMGSALLLPRLRARLSVDRLIGAAALMFAGATLALAYIRFLPLLVPCLMAGGMAWLATMSSLTVAAQTASPAWVRARTLGIYLLVFQGSMAVGSLAWGALAERLGNGTALSFAALILVGGLIAPLRWPLRAIQRLDLTPSGHWPDPKLAVIPDADDGPVLITVEYRVPVEQAGEFIQAMDAMRIFRRREGAVSWGIFRDLENPDRYVETFLVTTWAEHMRQHARVTVEDQATEAHTFSFLQPGVAPFASHLIAARTLGGDRQTPTEPPYAELS